MSGNKPQTRFFQTCLGVFQGGGCRAAAFGGAYEEAAARGVHFAKVAGTSAGAIAAALIGAGASPVQLKDSISRLEFTRFLVDPDPPSRELLRANRPMLIRLLKLTRYAPYRYFFSHLGMHSSAEIEKWVDDELRQLLGVKGRPVKFSDLLIPTWVVAADLRRRGVRVWNSRTNSDEEVARAVRASCSIPVFFQPVEARLVDGGTISNLPAFVFASAGTGDRPLSSRILAFSLEADEEELDASSAFSLVKVMLNTMIDGTRDTVSSRRRACYSHSYWKHQSH